VFYLAGRNALYLANMFIAPESSAGFCKWADNK
jgi:hypothetical protein